MRAGWANNASYVLIPDPVDKCFFFQFDPFLNYVNIKTLCKTTFKNESNVRSCLAELLQQLSRPSPREAPPNCFFLREVLLRVNVFQCTAPESEVCCRQILFLRYVPLPDGAPRPFSASV